MRLGRVFLLFVLGILIVVLSISNTKKTDSTIAFDVSWPNCGEAASNNSAWGIVGISGGLDFTTNPCLAQESSWFSFLSLYINTGYPGRSYGAVYTSYPEKCSVRNSRCLAYNYGYNATLYAINYANQEEVHTTLWWLDVETENSWTSNTSANRASLEGAVAALQQHTFLPTIGFYSYPSQWYAITGNWHNALPSWVATGSTSLIDAKNACKGVGFNGSSIWITQYTQRLDKNYSCSTEFIHSLNKL